MIGVVESIGKLLVRLKKKKKKKLLFLYPTLTLRYSDSGLENDVPRYFLAGLLAEAES